MKVLEGMPVRTWEYAPVVVPEVARQLVVGLEEVPQQVPRAEMAAGEPREVTLAPRVAPEVVMEVAVGLPRVGTEAAAFIVTVVHGPQLLPSFDSVTVPTNEVLLSAQTRMYLVGIVSEK